MKSSEIIKALKKKYHLTSDYQVHKLTGWSRQKVSHYANDNNIMSDECVILAAGLLEIQAGVLLAKVSAERSKRSDVKKVWEELARQLISSAAVICLILFGIAAPSPNAAQAATPGNQPNTVYYVKLHKWEC